MGPLQFIPSISLLSQRSKLKDVINIKDLPKSEHLGWIREIVDTTKKLKTALGEYVQESSNKSDVKKLNTFKDEIIAFSKDIAEIERTLGLSLCDSHQLIFCTECNAYVGEFDSLVTKCPKCNKIIKEEGKISVFYLDKISNSFLDGGIWFEDYMDKLLTSGGWKVWTHGSVMGSSGVLHPIDILAVRDNKVLIAECKTGAINTRDLSHFMIQKIDIQSHFGLFLSLQGCSNKSTVNLFAVSTSILVDNIRELSDTDIMGIINKHIDKFN